MKITLCGYPISNYYNKVKFVLLEKGIAFEEKLVLLGRGHAVHASSPLAKIPFIETPHGPLAESQAIVDWLEQTHPEPPLLPADAWQAAKLRELNAFLELHLEHSARQIYPQAFFNTPLPDEFLQKARLPIERSIKAVKQLAGFAPYFGGPVFTQVDCAAFVHLPLVALATKLIYGTDLLAAAGIDWKGYVRCIEQRPAAQRITADRKAAQAALASGS